MLILLSIYMAIGLIIAIILGTAILTDIMDNLMDGDEEEKEKILRERNKIRNDWNRFGIPIIMIAIFILWPYYLISTLFDKD